MDNDKEIELVDKSRLQYAINLLNQTISKKATASELSTVAMTGDYNDLKNKPSVSGGGGITEEELAAINADIAKKQDKIGADNKLDSTYITGLDKYDTVESVNLKIAAAQIGGGGEVDLSAYAQKTWVQEQGYATSSSISENYQPKGQYLTSYTETDPVFSLSPASGITEADKTNWSNKSTFSGNYNDLANKPTIPSITGLITESSADNKYQPKGEYLTSHQSLDAYLTINDANTNYQAKGSYVTPTGLTNELKSYAKTSDIPSIDGLLSTSVAASTYQPIGNYLTEHQSLSGYAKLTDIPSLDGYAKSTDITGFLNQTQVQSEIDSKLVGYMQIPTETLATQAWVTQQNYLTSHQDISSLATIDYVTSAIANAQLGGGEGSDIDLSLYATKEWVNGEGFLKSFTEVDPIFVASAAYGIKDTDISNWNSKTSFDGKYSSLTGLPTIPSIDGLLSKTDADGYYQPKGTYLTEHQSLSLYALKSEVPSIDGLLSSSEAANTYQPKGNYLTEHQSLSDYALKTDIPSLTGYATQTWVENKGYLTEHQSLVGYAKTTDIPSLDGYAKTTDIPSLDGYAKTTDIPSIDGLETSAHASETYQVKGEYLTSHQDISNKANVGDSYTKSESDEKYLTEHQSLEDYALKTDIPEVPSLDGYALKSEIPSLEGYAKTTDIPSLEGYSTFSGSYNDLTDKPTIPSTEGLISEADADEKYQVKGNYLTEHQSLVGYAKITDIPSVDGFATQTWVEGKGYLTSHQSLENYYDKDEVDSLVGAASSLDIQIVSTFPTEDISTTTFYLIPNSKSEGSDIYDEYLYVNNKWEKIGTTQVDLSSYALKSEIPSVSGLASESWVEGKGYLTEHQSLSGYAKTSDIPDTSTFLTQTDTDELYQPKGTYLTEHQSLESYALKSEIPSISGLATSSEVETAESNANSYTDTEIGKLTNASTEGSLANTLSKKANTSDLSAVATSGSYNDLSDTPTIPSISGLATETWVTEQGYLKTHQSLAGYLTTADANNTYQPKGTYLTEHQSLSGYATEEWVENKGYITAETEFNGSAAAGITSTDITNWNGKLNQSDISSWALSSTKPVYTADEVGALPSTTVIPSIDGLATETYVTEAIANIGGNDNFVEMTEDEINAIWDE